MECKHAKGSADGVGVRPRKCPSYIGCPVSMFVRTRRHVEEIRVGIPWKATAGGREAAHFPNVLPMEICSIVWFLAFMQFSFVCCSNLTPAAASRGGGLLGALNSASGRCLDEIMFLQVRSAKAGTQHDAGARLLSICPITLIRSAAPLNLGPGMLRYQRTSPDSLRGLVDFFSPRAASSEVIRTSCFTPLSIFAQSLICQ